MSVSRPAFTQVHSVLMSPPRYVALKAMEELLDVACQHRIRRIGTVRSVDTRILILSFDLSALSIFHLNGR
jgi:hypothetical protein